MKKITLGLLGLLVVGIILMLSCNSSKNLKAELGGEKVDWDSVSFNLGNWEEMNLNGKVERLIRTSFLVPKKSQQNSMESKNKLCTDTIFFDNSGAIKRGNIMSSFSSLIIIKYITLRSVFEDNWIFNPKDSLERNYFWYSSLNFKLGDTYKFIADEGMDEKIHSRRHYSEEMCNSKTFYNYQTNINQVEINIFDSKDVLRQKNVCKYNDENRIVSECLYYPNDSIKIKSTYSYDEKGNLSKYIHESSELKMTRRYEYENYDMQNNWLKRIEYMNGIVYSIVEREIEYFN